MKAFAIFAVAAGGFAGAAVAASATDAKRRPADPNEWVCEKIEVIGSRLATKRVCATRSEWADRRRQEREQLEKVQTRLCVVNPSTGGCNGQ